MRALTALLVATWLGLAAPASAQVPQTIVIDGVNDFDPSNLLDDDTGDTQLFDCGGGPVDAPLDLGKIYVTNDASFLYIGFEYQRFCFCDINIGVAIDTKTGGGTTDPFARKINWNDLASPPDYVVYDVIPTNCNAFNFEALYEWNAGTLAWDNISTEVNPGYGGGSDGLNIADADGGDFVEIKLPLSVLEISSLDDIGIELWVTQDGGNKPPLDAACSDTTQTSTPGGTVFDVAVPKEMDCYLDFTVLDATDNDPPIVNTANAVGFPLIGSTKQFILFTNKIDVTFNEPVDATTAQMTANYSVSGAGSPTIISAVRDAAATNVVHLTLGATISAAVGFYDVEVTGVDDLAANTIVDNDDTNIGSFVIRNVEFNGDMTVPLCKGIFAPTDTFAVEGNLLPLTFDIADNARMSDPGGDSTYTTTVPFALSKNRTTGKAQAGLLWKFTHTPAAEAFEPRPNRSYTVSSDSAASTSITGFWNDDDPANFLQNVVDVIFQVDASAISPTAGDTLMLQGSSDPLVFDSTPLPAPPAGIEMKDDGVFPDASPGDGIYTALARFPLCGNKNLGWKVFIRGAPGGPYEGGAYECTDQGDRSLFVNEAEFDTVGGPKGPLTLPARGINRCEVTDKPITVVFRVGVGPEITPQPLAGDTIGVASGDPSVPPLGNPPIILANQMADDGVAPDETLGDDVYTVEITFPDSTRFQVPYKYWYNQFTNNGYECEGLGDRNFTLDDVNFSTGTPLVLPLQIFNICTNQDLVSVPWLGGDVGSGVDFAVLGQSYPNPMVPRSTIRFDLRRSTKVSLKIYDLMGRKITTLVDAALQAGQHEFVWNGTDEDGRRVRSGVYMYELASPDGKLARRLVVMN